VQIQVIPASKHPNALQVIDPGMLSAGQEAFNAVHSVRPSKVVAAQYKTHAPKINSNWNQYAMNIGHNQQLPPIIFNSPPMVQNAPPQIDLWPSRPANNQPKDDDGAPYTLVRHYIRTYAYNDKDPRPSSVEFDNLLNVGVKNIRELPSAGPELMRIAKHSKMQQGPMMAKPGTIKHIKVDPIGMMRPDIINYSPVSKQKQSELEHI